MTNDINFWTGIKDPHLKPDKPFLTENKNLKVSKQSITIRIENK